MSTGMSQQTITGFRLSSQQERAWAQQQRSGSAAYKAQCAILLEGPVDGSRLRQALRQVVSRHEILHTVFHRQPGVKVPFQVIRETVEVCWEQVDGTSLGGLNPEEEAERLLAQARQREVDFENGPIVWACLVAFAPQKSMLLLTVPALCSDGRGLQNFVHDIWQSYVSPEGKPDEITQYADIVEWQRELLEGKETAAGREFWRDYGRRLSVESAESISLPLETKAPPAEFAPSLVASRLDAPVASQLDALLARDGGSPRDFLLSAWNVLNWRLTGSHPVVTCGFDGRKYEELENTVGLLAAYLPTHAAYDPESPFRRVTQAVADTCTELQQWQESFSWNEVEAKCPVLPFAFDYNEVPLPRAYGDVTLTWLRQYSCIDSFKLKLVAVRSGPELTLEFHYDSARLSRAAVEQIAGCFHTLLAAAVAQPDVAVSRLPLLNQAEQQRLLVDWNQTAAPYPNLCLHQLFETQAERTPDRPAVRFNQQVLSYRQLNQRANHLAHWLRRQGVGPDSLVGLCLERSADMIVALLGILKAGGAYVPLNPDNPKLRLAQQLTGAVALVTEQALLSRLPDFPGSTLCLDRDEHSWTEEPSDNPELNCTPDNLVYVIFTSGSTGVPKGVAVRHRNLVNYTHFITQLLQLERYPEGLQFATVSTLGADLGNTSIFPALVSGGCLHVIGYEVATDPQRLARYAEQYPMDVLKIVPSHLAALLNASDAGQLLPRRYLITGGETLTRTLVEKIASLHSSCELINHYGPTETTVGSL